ncbi:MAG: hypothetical protein GX444_14860 [Myxococcales bacterium]|nr:hypothetical protein [Myxococcales bacterium]
MAEKKLLSSGALTKELGISSGALKKLLAELKIEPVEKKGVCCMYDPAVVAKLKKAAKK